MSKSKPKFNTVEQATIPYMEITITTGRPTLRKSEEIKTGRQTFKIPFNIIRVRDTFNFRIKPEGMSQEDWEITLEIPEYAQSLLAGNDPPELIKGDFIDSGKFFIVSDGHRHFMAIARLLREGHTTYKSGAAIEEVEVMPNPQGFTDLDRFRQIFSTNRSMALNPVEIAKGMVRIKEEYFKIHSKEMTNEQLADFIGGVSRQWIDMMLIVAKLNPDIQAGIIAGKIKVTNAVALYRDENKKKKTDPVCNEVGEVINPAEKPKSVTKDIDLTEGNKTAGSTGANLNGKDQEDEEDDEDDTHEGMGGDQDLKKTTAPPAIVDNKSVHKQEEEANLPPSGSFKEIRPKNDREDALAKIDFKKEKTEAEMDINEVKKLLDKMEVRNNTLPVAMKQFRDDQNSLLNFIQKKLDNVLEVIKKAPDER